MVDSLAHDLVGVGEVRHAKRRHAARSEVFLVVVHLRTVHSNLPNPRPCLSQPYRLVGSIPPARASAPRISPAECRPGSSAHCPAGTATVGRCPSPIPPTRG